MVFVNKVKLVLQVVGFCIPYIFFGNAFWGEADSVISSLLARVTFCLELFGLLTDLLSILLANNSLSYAGDVCKIFGCALTGFWQPHFYASCWCCLVSGTLGLVT